MLKKIFICVLAFMFLIMGSFYYLCHSESGNHLLLKAINKLTPAQVNFASAKGAITNNLSISDLSVHYENVHITARQFNISIEFVSLLKGVLNATSLVVIDPTVIIKQTESKIKEDQPKTLNLSYLSHIRLERAQIKNISIYHNDQPPQQITALALEKHKDTYHIELRGDSFTGTGKLYPSKLRGVWKIKLDDLSKFNQTWQGSVFTEGNVDLNRPNLILNAKAQANSIVFAGFKIQEISAKFDSKDNETLSHLTLFNINKDNYNIKSADLAVKSNLRNNNISSIFNLVINNSKLAEGNLAIDKALSQTSTIKGKIHLHTNENFNINIENIKYSHPDLNLDVSIDGTLKKPLVEFDGKASCNEIIYLPYMTSVSDLTLRIFHRYGGEGHLEGSFLMGEGKAHLSGALKQSDTFNFDLSLVGENLRIVNTAEYKVSLSPTLKLNHFQNKTALNGNIFVDQADIRPISITKSVKPSNDIEYINDTSAKNDIRSINDTKTSSEGTASSDLKLNVNVKLSNDIRITYDKLKATLTGNLALRKIQNASITATGELSTIKGSYNAYNNQLIIEKGRLIYAGNAINNPGLEIKAVKKIESVKLEKSKSSMSDNKLDAAYGGTESLAVGVFITGTVNTPIISLISEPEQLDQADILSYLMFGYPKEKITSTSSLTLLNNVLSSGNNGVNFTKKVQKALSLSELNFGQTEYYDPSTNSKNSASTLSIGKKFGKNLSVNYTLGLFDPISILKLKYRINPHLSIQSETSSLDTGVDLLYEIETD